MQSIFVKLGSDINQSVLVKLAANIILPNKMNRLLTSLLPDVRNMLGGMVDGVGNAISPGVAFSKSERAKALLDQLGVNTRKIFYDPPRNGMVVTHMHRGNSGPSYMEREIGKKNK